MPRLFQLWLLVISVGSCVQLTVCSHFYSSLFFLSFFEHLASGTTRCASSQISHLLSSHTFSLGMQLPRTQQIPYIIEKIPQWMDMLGIEQWQQTAEEEEEKKNIKSKCNSSRSNTVWNASAWDQQFLKLLLHHGIIQYVLSDLTSLRLPRLRCLIGSTKNTFICAFIHLIKKENY